MSVVPPPRDEANWLLAQLSDPAYARVRAISEHVDLHHKDVLSEPGEPIEFAHFPETACLSIITMMNDGHAVEVGTVGPEGLTGLSFIHGINSEPTRNIVQIRGSGKRIERAAFVAELKENREFADLVGRYAQAWTEQIARSGSCNAVHSIDERCAR